MAFPRFHVGSVSVLHQFHIKALSSLALLRLLNVLLRTPRSLNPRRLDIILDLELELLRYIQQLHIEQQGRVGRDGASGTTLTVAQF